MKSIKKHKLTHLIIVLFLLSFIGLFWLATGVLVATLIFILINKTTRGGLHFFCNLILTVLLVILSRVFLFEFYGVPSESMEDELYSGDIIVVSKLNYGPKVSIPFVEIPCTQNNRLTGFSGIRYADVIVFKSLNDVDEYLVKRCIGLPGDTLQILNGRTIINNTVIKNASTVKLSYELQITNKKRFINYTDNLKIKYYWNKPMGEAKSATALLNSLQLRQLHNTKFLHSITPTLDRKPGYFSNYNTNWTVDNFGPLVIPSRGFTIKLDKTVYTLYKKLIRRFEGKQIYESKGRFYLNNKPVDEYVFTNDYYFFLGDNRSKSFDSRFWGPVPESHIEGKAVTSFSFN